MNKPILPLKKADNGLIIPTKKDDFRVRTFFDVDTSTCGIDVFDSSDNFLKEIYGESIDETDEDSVANIIKVLEEDSDL